MLFGVVRRELGPETQAPTAEHVRNPRALCFGIANGSPAGVEAKSNIDSAIVTNSVLCDRRAHRTPPSRRSRPASRRSASSASSSKSRSRVSARASSRSTPDGNAGTWVKKNASNERTSARASGEPTSTTADNNPGTVQPTRTDGRPDAEHRAGRSQPSGREHRQHAAAHHGENRGATTPRTVEHVEERVEDVRTQPLEVIAEVANRQAQEHVDLEREVVRNAAAGADSPSM